jgi:putative transposase
LCRFGILHSRVVTYLTDNPGVAGHDAGMDSDRIFFVTAVAIERRAIFQRDAVAGLLVETLAHYRDRRKFLLHEFVVMPDHVHLLLTPAPEISLERAMQFIKGGFSFRMKAAGSAWQSGFSGHRVLDWGDYECHLEHIWLNPVRAGLVETAGLYPYSSAAGTLRMDTVPQGLRPRLGLVA